MSEPFVAERFAQPLDLLEKGLAGDGWPGLEGLVPPTQLAELAPKDPVAMFLYGMTLQAGGREVIEWLMDITVRQPLRCTASTIENTALMTATRQGINGVGEAVLKAIAKGRELAEQPRSETPNGEQS
ncbi:MULTISPECIES: hypothetical protein [unclassified Rhizobium]|uniref:hypothetical protein n=1 Tax=unclassified Rhizobium TaxID=2613769 RepID=UPI00161F1BFA|nr:MULTISPECIES: hypothetical protein [unclassified Rhizobium]MBB3385991.1 hypothetical protein [Rhizobium sp. BK098]MBB3617831.1 hypothetical protein [Rhizobium sp. BK609]MBB3683353.1 hypothetical protein [Rhizobium sp. BK612]